LADNADILDDQGSVQEFWRVHKEKRLGPYFRLVYREGQAQRTRYLGRDEAFAEKVRMVLRELQASGRRARDLDRLLSQICREMLRQKRQFNYYLAKQGLYLKGSEIRGRRSRLCPLVLPGRQE
jgi:hypothetical protein